MDTDPRTRNTETLLRAYASDRLAGGREIFNPTELGAGCHETLRDLECLCDDYENINDRDEKKCRFNYDEIDKIAQIQVSENLTKV